MRPTILLFLMYLLHCLPISSAHAQDSTNTLGTHMRISLLTLSPGSHTLEALGHVAIRITDSSRTDEWRDVVFNYGTFNLENGFLSKALTGQLNFYLSVFRFDTFMKLFVAPERGLEEQEFLLTPPQKLKLAMNLQQNSLPQNKYYNYNFFADNCSTRIYYMLKETFGNSFQHQKEFEISDMHTTYYGILPLRNHGKHWEELGALLFFQSKMVQVVSPVDAVSFPPMLSKILQSATINGKPLYGGHITLQKSSIAYNSGINQPLILSLALLLLTAIGLFKPLAKLGAAMQYILLIGTGFIGCVLLWAWFIANYSGTQNNLNLLWALPFNIMLPFLRPALKKKYAIMATCLIGLSLIFHMFGIQKLPLPELFPLSLALIIVFASMYRHPYRTAI